MAASVIGTPGSSYSGGVAGTTTPAAYPTPAVGDLLVADFWAVGAISGVADTNSQGTWTRDYVAGVGSEVWSVPVTVATAGTVNATNASATFRIGRVIVLRGMDISGSRFIGGVLGSGSGTAMTTPNQVVGVAAVLYETNYPQNTASVSAPWTAGGAVMGGSQDGYQLNVAPATYAGAAAMAPTGSWNLKMTAYKVLAASGAFGPRRTMMGIGR